MPEILDLEEEIAAPAEEVTAEVEAEAEAPVIEEKPAESPADQSSVKTSLAKPEPIQTVKDLPYDWEKCVVAVSLTFLPDDGDVRGRPVAVGLRTHEDVPLMCVLRESDFTWPQQVQQMLENLKLMLPHRGEEAAARKAEEEKKTAEKTAELKKKAMERTKSAKTAPSAKPVKTTVKAEKPAPVAKPKKASMLPADQPDLFAMFSK